MSEPQLVLVSDLHQCIKPDKVSDIVDDILNRIFYFKKNEIQTLCYLLHQKQPQLETRVLNDCMHHSSPLLAELQRLSKEELIEQTRFLYVYYQLFRVQSALLNSDEGVKLSLEKSFINLVRRLQEEKKHRKELEKQIKKLKNENYALHLAKKSNPTKSPKVKGAERPRSSSRHSLKKKKSNKYTEIPLEKEKDDIFIDGDDLGENLSFETLEVETNQLNHNPQTNVTPMETKKLEKPIKVGHVLLNVSQTRIPAAQLKKEIEVYEKQKHDHEIQLNQLNEDNEHEYDQKHDELSVTKDALKSKVTNLKRIDKNLDNTIDSKTNQNEELHEKMEKLSDLVSSVSFDEE